MKFEKHKTLQLKDKVNINMYTLIPGLNMAFNQVYTDQCAKGEPSFYSKNMLIINFCVHGRCEATLSNNKSAIVKENEICISTIPPSKDFYYPGRLYEGVQLYLDLTLLNGDNYLSFLGIDLNQLNHIYCNHTGLYIHQMDESLSLLIKKIWNTKDHCEYGQLRYFAVSLLHEIMHLPNKSDTDSFFTRSQIAIVKEAESIIMIDLSQKYTAKELATRFGISESSFKQYIKGILGESYLNYFRRKRMEKAAELLKSTNMKIIEIANLVGYENQGKFANSFAKEYGVTPLEYRRLVNNHFND